MSLPVPSKKWQIATLVSALTGTDFGNQADLIFQVKQKRKAFGHVVAGSGDGASGGMDGVDRWTSTGSLVTGSWVAILQPGSGAMDVLQVDNGLGENDYAFVHSPGGLFTGGGPTTRPTATDQTVLYSNSFYGRNDGGHALPLICHLSVSTDLTCCRMIHFFNDNPFGNVVYDAAEDPVSGWVSPNFGIVDKVGFNKNSSCDVGDVARWTTEFSGGGTGIFSAWAAGGSGTAMPMTAVVAGTGIGNIAGRTQPLNMALLVKNGFSKTYRYLPKSLLFRNPANSDPGIHGEMFDCWWVPHASFTPGVTTPLAGSKEFIIVGDQMWPWNGTVPATH